MVIPISGYTIAEEFKTSDGKCVKESIIERTFDNKIRQASNNKVDITKASFEVGTTDGIMEFYIEDKLSFWILQECKREEGPSIVNMSRAFLQSMMYLGNIFSEDFSYYSYNKFKGIFLDSAIYFCFIPREEIINLFEEFKPLYNKYRPYTSPCRAYQVEDLDNWAILSILKIRKYVYRLDDNFRLDEIIKDLYNNKL